MKKKNNSWIAAGLFTIATGIATIYSLLEYRESVLIMGITSLLLLLSAFWLFTSISRLLKKEPEVSVGQEQRERMNYEGMKLQGEELIRLMNTFGKGTYAYSKRSAENLRAILEFTIQTQTSNERLLNDLIQNQTKTAKFQVKYRQEDTAKLIQNFTEQCRQLNDNLILCVDKIENQKVEITSQQPDAAVSNSLNDLSMELAHINTSIQALQLQLATAAQPSVVYAPAPQVPVTPVPEASTEVPAMEDFKAPEPEIENISADMTDADITDALTEALSEPEPAASEEILDTEEPVITEEPVVVEEPVVAEEPVIAEEPVATEEPVAAEEPVVAEEPAEMERPSNVIEFTTGEPAIAKSEVIAEEESIPQAPEPEEPAVVEEAAIPEPPVIVPPSDNPNKQLSADEIAALFASLG
ncbi:MAG: hypothetical protein NC089_02445 [Bacteroides sp.]|nr:hypothetical protein [Bacteroides sp.]MCM1550119.1 hypothetical protein [Clostridium sp.]